MISAMERFEYIGDLYYRDQGRLRPGKSNPLETGVDSNSPENVAMFDEWMARRCFSEMLERLVQLEKMSNVADEMEDIADEIIRQHLVYPEDDSAVVRYRAAQKRLRGLR